jgi:hypothetical protein
MPGRVLHPWAEGTREKLRAREGKTGGEEEVRHSNRALDFANLPIKLPNVIFAIAAVAGLPFVAGQSIVILLLDVGVPAHGLEIVPP